MNNSVKLGYAVDSGKEVKVKLSHLIVTGVTQESGKTTTLEAITKRAGCTAIVFTTKIGEKSFLNTGVTIPPFFRDRSDYEFVSSLIEAYAKSKMVIEKGTLMRLCEGTSNLIDIKKRVDDEIAGGKLRGINQEIYTRLQYYLKNLIPQIQYGGLSTTLNTVAGQVNKMNLDRYSEEVQSLIMESTVTEVLKKHTDVIIIIPEAWKFIPQKYNNPCKRSVESFIRQGAANRNFIWLDSQDMTGVDKTQLKQVSTWLLGYQAEKNEVKHTLDQISLPAKSKPKPEEIMNLRKGHFYLVDREGVKLVYVQPIWLGDDLAKAIAKGEKSVDEIGMDEVTPVRVSKENETQVVSPDLPSFHHNPIPLTPVKEQRDTEKILRKEITDLGQAIYQKISEIFTAFRTLQADVFAMAQRQPAAAEIDIDAIVLKVMQAMPAPDLTKPSAIPPVFDREQIINEVIARMPAGGQQVIVSPLEALHKKFLEDAKSRILKDIADLSAEQKTSLLYAEVRGAQTSRSEIYNKGLGIKGGYSGGGAFDKGITALVQKGFLRKDNKSRLYPALMSLIEAELSTFTTTDEERKLLYNHILTEISK